MDRPDYPVRKSSLHEVVRDADYDHLTPEERLAMVWTLTVQAWIFKEGQLDESGLRRDVIRVLRGGS